MGSTEELLGSMMILSITKVQQLEAQLQNKQALIEQQTQNITALKKEVEELKKAKK